MTTSPLALRISRRAIAGAQIRDDALTLLDGRHLTSRTDRAIATVTRYVEHLLGVCQPRQIVVHVPLAVPSSSTEQILRTIEALGRDHGIPVRTVARSDLLTAYGVLALRSRDELRAMVRSFWPELANITGKVEPYVADAAATALYADCEWCLRGGPP